jgi:hypothetical protein
LAPPTAVLKLPVHKGIQRLTEIPINFRLESVFADLYWKRAVMERATIVKPATAVTPVLLTPKLVEKMISRRQQIQVLKFRTTCTDCVPNY